MAAADEAERWERVQELFHAVVDLPAAERARFLRDSGADEAETSQVLAMCARDGRRRSLLAGDLASLATDVIGGGAEMPRQIGPYRIIGLLGEGGMGTVYRAQRTDLDSVVAIKVLSDVLSPARRDSFAREQKLLAHLNHRSIAHLHDAGVLPDGTPFFAMELVEGLAITEHCRAHASSIAERLRLFRDVCEAVQYAHRELVLHRDLKPSNIFVTKDGRVKLLDFGIAKRLDPEGAEPARTGLQFLSTAYAAPEWLRGESVAVDADVYSLGVVLYELLTGGPVFDLDGRSLEEGRAILLEQVPEKPSVVVARRAGAASAGDKPPPTVSRSRWADLDVLTLTAMHKDRARRYATVEALIGDLDRDARGEPLKARADSVGYRAGKFVGRHRRALAGVSLSVGALVTVAGVYTWRLKTARDVARAEAQRTQRVEDFTLKLFDGGQGPVGPKTGLLAITLVENGEREVEDLAKEPVVQADILNVLGVIYQKLGKFEKAEALLNRALAQRRALFGADAPPVGKSLINLGLLRNEQNRFAEAEPLVRQGKEMVWRAELPEAADLLEAASAVGQVLESRGSYPQAIALMEDALKRVTALEPTSPAIALGLTDLANKHFYAGHYEESRALNERALALDRKLYGDQHPTVSSDLINLGAIKFERGQYVEAEALYRQGLAITEAWYGHEHAQTAADEIMLARALNLQERQPEALTLVRHALAINERVFGQNNSRVASVVNELGSIALGADRYDEAEQAYRRMLEIYKVTYGDTPHYLRGLALSNLASTYLARGNNREAEALYRDALAVYAKTLSPDHNFPGVTHIKLGRALLRQGRFAEAVVESRAGYENVKKQATPGLGFLQKARADLGAAYEALHQPDEARRFRDELLANK